MRPLAKEHTTPSTLSILKIALLKRSASVILSIISIYILSSCSGYSSAVAWPKAGIENKITTSHAIPIYKLGKLILIKGEIKGITGYFIFDTGAPGLVLNDQHFKNFETDPTRKVTGVNGQIHDARVYYVHNLKLGEVGFKSQVADVIDLSHIEEKRNVKILGLLGVNLFRGVELEIDLRKHLLRIFKTDKEGNRLHKKAIQRTSGLVSMPFRYSGALIELKAEINNQFYRIAFDTGSETLLLDKGLVIKDSIKSSLLTNQNLLSTDGSKSGMEIRELENIKIGLNLNKVTMLTADFKSLRAYGLNVDGLIGYDLIASGVITINFKNRILQIQPYAKA